MLSLKPDVEQQHVTNAAEEQSLAPKRKYMISTKASWALSVELGGEDQVDELRSLVGDAKAVKNKVELEGVSRLLSNPLPSRPWFVARRRIYRAKT